MVATNQDFTIVSGDVGSIRYTITDAASDALDLTTATDVKWQSSKLKSNGTFSSTPKISKSTADGVTVTDAAGGIVDVSIEPEDTDALSGDYYTELQVEFANGPYTVASGTMTVVKDLIT